MGKQINIKDWSFLSLVADQPAADLQRQAEELVTQRHHEMGLGFQAYLFSLVRTLRTLNPVVIETGVNSGLSTYFLLQALGQRPDAGVLVSIDPMYKSKDIAGDRIGNVDLRPFWKNQHRLFNKWEFFSGKSIHVFDQVIARFPEWDVFIHDSDHSRENMRYELEFAWKYLKEGGFLIVDDARGVDTTGFHDETEKFLTKYNLDWTTIGETIIVQKPGTMAEEKLLTGLKVTIVPLDQLAAVDPAGNEVLNPSAPAEPIKTEEEELAEREAALAVATKDLPPLPGVTPAEEGPAEEIFEEQEENGGDGDAGSADADLDRLIGEGGKDEGEGFDPDDSDPDDAEKKD